VLAQTTVRSLYNYHRLHSVLTGRSPSNDRQRCQSYPEWSRKLPFGRRLCIVCCIFFIFEILLNLYSISPVADSLYAYKFSNVNGVPQFTLAGTSARNNFAGQSVPTVTSRSTPSCLHCILTISQVTMVLQAPESSVTPFSCIQI